MNNKDYKYNKLEDDNQKSDIDANQFLVLKWKDIHNFLSYTEIEQLKFLIRRIETGRFHKGLKIDNEYWVVNKDEPYSKKIIDLILEEEKKKHDSKG